MFERSVTGPSVSDRVDLRDTPRWLLELSMAMSTSGLNGSVQVNADLAHDEVVVIVSSAAFEPGRIAREAEEAFSDLFDRLRAHHRATHAALAAVQAAAHARINPQLF